MWHALVQAAGRLAKEVSRALRRGLPPKLKAEAPVTRPSVSDLQPLERLQLTDGVSHTLFEEYAAHRRGPRGEEEIGWILLGVREGSAGVALATLPAGTERNAGVAHVQFDAEAQALGSVIVRQEDRRLNMLGVVHTHPGSLRHPSDADFRGDSEWVAQLRGKQGVFGIGTADAKPGPDPQVETSPRPNVRCLGKLCYSWYGLRAGDAQYVPLPVELRMGPDLARPLHPVWETITVHARRLNRLFRQQAKLEFDVVEGPALRVTLPLAEPGGSIRVLLKGKQIRYFLERDGDLLAAEGCTDCVDQGVYLMLAELASQF
jgi:proteasome lid subunit RPN8/RPN11